MNEYNELLIPKSYEVFFDEVNGKKSFLTKMILHLYLCLTVI